MDFFLWVALPYISFALLIGGMIWRWKTDQYGWTSRSSQIYESKLLRLSSPLFHLGIIFVGLGHVMGLVFPKAMTNALGISEHSYHLVATIGGSVAALMTVLGLIGLLYRRFVIKSVRLSTSRNDVFMYIMLLIAICLGTTATLVNQVFGEAGGYDYRETIGPWFRSIFYFQPDPALMANVPLTFKLHVIAGLLLFAVWPFTRLVHVLSAPIGYPTRPYVVYRSREAATGAAKPARGWKKVDHSSDDYYTGGARPSGA
ncbi:respiratory nitrate reductase subunit gamma [Boudabousia tangfeifanii]|nr:respiratory nitrate reductase subunit gamma [Boudabousia tangfeifanii]